MKLSFDECFQVFPAISEPAQFQKFWAKAREELKKTPVDPKVKIILKKSIGRFSTYEISFSGLGNERISGYLSTPKMKGPVPVIICFHDYLYNLKGPPDNANSGCAHLVIRLRDHNPALFATEDASTTSKKRKYPVTKYGLETTQASFAFACYLDAMRCIDFLRLQKGLETSNMGVIGHGFGAAMAIFLAALAPENIKALCLERPGFVWHKKWLDDSTSLMAKEINKLLRPGKNISTKIKNNLALLDPLIWSEKLQIPILCHIGMEDEINPARPAFGFFNHLKTDKDMEIFTDDSDDPLFKLQRQKSILFLNQQLTETVPE